MPKCKVEFTEEFEQQMEELDWSVRRRIMAKIEERVMAYGTELNSESVHGRPQLLKIKISSPAEARAIYGIVGNHKGIDVAIMLSAFLRKEKDPYAEGRGYADRGVVNRLNFAKANFNKATATERDRKFLN